ncbi:MAG: amino acid adenylation domain-containing protein [Candidatus Acidiferrales bacterium]
MSTQVSSPSEKLRREQIGYWKDQLSDAAWFLELPTDKVRLLVPAFPDVNESFELPKQLSERLKSVAKREQATLFMLLEAAFVTLLHRYSGQDDILVGTVAPASTKGESGEPNKVILRSRFAEGLSFRSHLQQVKHCVLGAFANSSLPLEDIVSGLDLPQTAGRGPLVQAMFVFQDSGAVAVEHSKCDLALSISDTAKGLKGAIDYRSDLFKPETIRHICGHFITLLNAIGDDPEQSLSRMPMLTAAETKHLLNDWNDTATEYSGKDRGLHELFEEQAARTPSQVALVFEGQRLTYAELNHRANQLANHLRNLGAGPNVLIGLFVERSLEMLVGLLGVLKSGAAYVPIDTTFPQDRISFMLGDANVAALLTQSHLVENLPACAAPVVCLDRFNWSGDDALVQSKLPFRPDNLAYVIYTSGSTGRPKGVGIEHRNIVNYTLGVSDRLQFTAGMNHATVSTIAADLGNTVIFPALVTGGCLHIVSKDRIENQALLAEYFERERIDVLKIVPSHLAALLTGRNAQQVIPRQRLILGGEASRLDFVEKLRSLSPNTRIFNHYGPTETTVGVLTYDASAHSVDSPSGNLPIGKPLPNSRIYILDAHGQPVPSGVPGELYIGGAGVARGYLNRPELTAEKFIADPFGREPSGKLYRTGDRARYLPDGNIEFCGRIDFQVKIHGHRVELGEIEAALRSQPGVRDAVVQASDDESGDKHLNGYVVPKRANQPLWDFDNLYVLPDGSTVAHLNKNETSYIYNEIFVLQAYLRHGITVEDGDCIVDAGSNIGLFTVFASRLAQNLRIVSFEPNPAVYACLKANAEAWGTNVRCLQLGLSSENKFAEMTFFEGFSLLSGFYADEAKEREVVKTYALNQNSDAADSEDLAKDVSKLLEDRFRAKTQSAQLKTLSSIIAEEGLDRIDLLKINVEKSELDVLLGIADADWAKIRQMVIEVDLSQSLEPITGLLESKGYEVLVEQDPLLRKTELCYVYAIRPSESGNRLLRQQAPDAHVRKLPPVSEEILTPALLQKYLRDRLPQYMVPSAFVLMEKFPLTANGKLDRKMLPIPASKSIQPVHEFIPPSTENEKLLAAMWTEMLRVEKVGLNDDFFDLGGHSLVAIKIISRIRDVFEVDLPTQTLFEHPTIAGLARVLAEAKNGNRGAQHIERRKQTGPSPLSFSQEQLWFLDQLAPGSPVYNVVDVIRFEGRYDADAITKTLNELVRRHEILRTVFYYGDGRPMQAVLPDIDLAFKEIDLSFCSKQEKEREWKRMVEDQGRQPFDLSQAPLFRVAMVHLSPREHKMLLVIHHIIADEWSMQLIHREVNQLYQAFSQGRNSPLPALPIQYADFAAWQRGWMHGDALEAETAHWRKELAGAPTVLDLPTDKPRPAVQSFRGSTEFFDLPKELSEQLKTLAREQQATLFMILEAGFAVLLNRYTGQDDILVGTPISGRTCSETEQLIGFFLNTVVLRAQFTERMNFRSLLQQVRQRAWSAYAHPDMPLEQLVAELSPERHAGQTPLFQVLFVMHDSAGVSEVSKVSGNQELATGTSKFDLTLTLSETAGGLQGLFEYNTDLFEAATIRGMAAHYRTLLGAIARDLDQSISKMPMLTETERRQLLTEWNDTAVVHREKHSCLHRLIEEQAERTPERIALVYDEHEMTYREMNRRAEQLSNHLRGLGVGPGVLVGLLVERSLDMVVGLLGILKAGGAYVPLDPSFPEGRLSYMVEDSKMKILVTHRGLDESLAVRPSMMVCLDSDWGEIEKAAEVSTDPAAANGKDLAYVLYTSGSTGKPKGVEVPHSAIVNFVLAMQETPGFTGADTLLAVTTLSFDIAALELYVPLICGGTVAIASREETHDPVRLQERMRQSGCTVMQATPATWRALIHSGWMGSANLKILCGGEALPRHLADELLTRCGQLWNMYGPTETTVWSAVHHVESGDGPVPIGRPIANTQLYVLDKYRNLVPRCAVGELYIGGDGLARGYLHREELTRERFVPNPFVRNARMYRTGDLARWLPDGTVECLGRADNQVKIRGFRIELGEVEVALASHKAVRQCVVLARHDVSGNDALAAFFVPKQAGSAPAQSDLRAYLKKALPDYMIPSVFVSLERLPLTPNGKIDRKALLAVSLENTQPVRDFAEPSTETEKSLAAIWSGLLNVKNIGVNDDFFDLGGHSLLAIALTIDIKRLMGKALPLASFMQAPTIHQLSRLIDSAQVDDGKLEISSAGLSLVQAAPETRYEPFALNDIQQAYMIGRSDGVELGNIPCQFYAEVDVDNWNAPRFEIALEKMIERHEMLRCIVLPDGRQQILRKAPSYRVETYDLRGLDPVASTARLRSTREQMMLQVHPAERWPLFEFRASRLDDSRTRLHIRIELLVSDGRSHEIFFGELMQLYQDPQAVLPPLELSFKDYLAALVALEKTEAFQKSKSYWEKRVPSLPASPDLPLAKNPATIGKPIFSRRSARIDADVWRKVKANGSRFRVTPSGILLAAYAEVLAMWSKSQRFTVNLALFNRLPLHPQANEIIGDFTAVNLLAVDNATPQNFVQRAGRHQEQLWQDLDHRFFSGIEVMREWRRFQGVGPTATMPIVFTSLLNLDGKGGGSTWSHRLGQPVFGQSQTPQVYIDLIVLEDEGSLLLNWDAIEELFEKGMLDDMFESLQHLLLDLASDDESWNRNLSENSRRLLPSAQRETRERVNATDAPISSELLHTAFLKQVAERPGQEAIVTPGRRLTYRETYQLACRIEKELLDLGVKPNRMVGVLMDKGWEQVVACLGIHFAGAAYLPIDSELPVARQKYLMEHGDTKIILTQSQLLARLDVPEGVTVLAVDRMEPLDSDLQTPRLRQKPEDLAYVIYTSGSTGLPKGVMIDHRGALNTVLDINQRFNIGPQDRVLALSRLNFDLSVYDIFGLLGAGGAIVMPSAELAQDVPHWIHLVASEKVTVWNSVPALMQLFIEDAECAKRIGGQSLRLVMMSGDWIPVNLPGQIQRALPNSQIISLGGATEASIWSILHPIEKVDPNWKSIPYGKPMLNQTFHVLNQVLAPCPTWVPGSLYIGGIGLAKGYWRDEQKTNASFILHPMTGERLYRTGDLGRYLPDGNIEFLGREDFQVKVQGYRIELGEIEARMQEYPGVDLCMVTVREDTPKEKRLVGYLVAKHGMSVDPADLREHLSAKLPGYMVPSAIVTLDHFPLSPNGKVDRKALPAPERTFVGTASNTTASRDSLDLQLTKLWENVLGVRPIGLRDNFFDLGGTSLAAVRLFSKMRKLFNRSFPLSVLIQAPTVEKLADLVRRDGWSPRWISLVPIQPGGSKPPFFCVHGGGGNVLIYKDLAKHLGQDYPFYGLQARGLDGSRDYLTTVEAMADSYLIELQELQPEGPYYIGGFCMGGQIAFEMARKLVEKGQKVNLLVLIDSHNFNGRPLQWTLREKARNTKQKIEFHVSNILKLSLRDRFGYFREKSQFAFRRELGKLRVRMNHILKLNPHRDVSGPIEQDIEAINDRAYFSYFPGVYPNKLTLFRPHKNYAFLSDPMNGWETLVAGGIEAIDLPVHPGGIFVEPFVRFLAEKLRERIDRSDSARPVSENERCERAMKKTADRAPEYVEARSPGSS